MISVHNSKYHPELRRMDYIDLTTENATPVEESSTGARENSTDALEDSAAATENATVSVDFEQGKKSSNSPTHCDNADRSGDKVQVRC